MNVSHNTPKTDKVSEEERIIALLGKIAEAKTKRHQVRVVALRHKFGIKLQEEALEAIAAWDRLEQSCELLLEKIQPHAGVQRNQKPDNAKGLYSEEKHEKRHSQ